MRRRQMIQGQSVGVDDRIQVVLDPFNNMRTGYMFQLNPNGVRRDGVFDRATSVNEDWDGIWHAEAVIDEEGWTAEIQIPFKTLNFDPDNPDWGFTVARSIPRKQKGWLWSSYTQPSTRRPGSFRGSPVCGRAGAGTSRRSAGQQPHFATADHEPIRPVLWICSTTSRRR